MWKPGPDALLIRSYLFGVLFFAVTVAVLWVFGADLRLSCTDAECATNSGYRWGTELRPLFWAGFWSLVASVALNGLILDLLFRRRDAITPGSIHE